MGRCSNRNVFPHFVDLCLISTNFAAVEVVQVAAMEQAVVVGEVHYCSRKNTLKAEVLSLLSDEWDVYLEREVSSGRFL